MGIDNRRKGFVVTGGDGTLQSLAECELFAHAFENQNVRIHRHTDGQNDTCQTRQRKRRADASHHAENQEKIHSQCNHRHHATHRIVGDHESADEDRANHGSSHAA